MMIATRAWGPRVRRALFGFVLFIPGLDVDVDADDSRSQFICSPVGQRIVTPSNHWVKKDCATEI